MNSARRRSSCAAATPPDRRGAPGALETNRTDRSVADSGNPGHMTVAPGGSLVDYMNTPHEGVAPGRRVRERRDTACDGTWWSTRQSRNRSTVCSPIWPTRCDGTSSRPRVCSGARSAISRRESGRAGWPPIGLVHSGSTSLTSWPRSSRPDVSSGCRPRRGTRRVEYICTPVGASTNVRASYEGDISGSLRLLTGWLPPGVVRWILAQDFRRLDQRLERETQAASRWQQGYLADVALR